MKSAVCCARRRPRSRTSIFPTWCGLGPQAARCKKIFACWWDLAQRRCILAWLVRMLRVARRLDSRGGTGVYSLSPEALCVAVAREVGCIQAFALAQELCSKISLSDRGKYLPPYTSPVTNKLAKDKDQPPGVATLRLSRC
ncbi:MAG: hypothetical protein ACLTYW_07420 [Collinsella sp.]